MVVDARAFLCRRRVVPLIYLLRALACLRSLKGDAHQRAFLFPCVCLSLCSEQNKTIHYSIQHAGKGAFVLNDKTFADLPQLIAYFRLHPLDVTVLTTPLVRMRRAPCACTSSSVALVCARARALTSKRSPP